MSAIETRLLPALARSYPRHFTFYVADPISSIASSAHCKHLPRMTPGFGAGLVIPDLWQQEAVRALQQGKDPPPRLWGQGGAGADRIGQDLHLRAALSEPENSGGVHRPTLALKIGSCTEPGSSTASWKARSRASPTRAHALHPNHRDRQSCIISRLRCGPKFATNR